ncbi:MAG: undecaprenyl-diphosphate phosphatase [Candidatus Marinimicrobia bacterium]|nr:undecaprenyl-diphosphate phosphatase [Candidatus Neomarinimicrobiota bacterium]
MPINSLSYFMITQLTLNDSLLLGVLQGFTEFLPISSSGHLIVAQALLGIKKSGISFEIFVHFGTLMSIFVMFRKDIGAMTVAFLKTIRNPKNIAASYRSDKQFNLFVVILIATLPAGVIGILFKESFEMMFITPNFVGYAFIMTGIILFSTKFAISRSAELGIGNGLIIGFVQAFAIIPGISRAGSTIGVGMLRGINGEEAARFSFLLAIPAIGGATLLQVFDIFEYGLKDMSLTVAGAGIISSFLTGIFAIRILMGIMKRGKLHYFSWYCIILGVVTILYV